MTWFALADTNTGALVSITDVVAEPLPPSLTAYPLANEPNLRAVMWDASTRTFVSRPAKVIIDRLQDLLTDPAYADFQTIYSGLSAQRKTQIQTVLIRLLGKNRYRAANESVEVG